MPLLHPGVSDDLAPGQAHKRFSDKEAVEVPMAVCALGASRHDNGGFSREAGLPPRFQFGNRFSQNSKKTVMGGAGK